MAGAVNAVSEFDGYKQMTDEAETAAAPDAILMIDLGGDHVIEGDVLLSLPAISTRRSTAQRRQAMTLTQAEPVDRAQVPDRRVRARAAQLWLALLLGLTCALSLDSGASGVSLFAMPTGQDQNEALAAIILWEVCLPRIALGALVGAVRGFWSMPPTISNCAISPSGASARSQAQHVPRSPPPRRSSWWRWVVPHLLRLVNCALLDASLLLAADMIARLVIAPAELPIGIVTAVLGTPVFMSILLRSPDR